MIKNSELIFLSLLLIGQFAYSQTKPCDLKLKDGKIMQHKRMVGLHENFLLISDTGSYKILNIDKVANVKFDKGSYLWTGAAIGAAVGFIGGFVYYTIFNGAKKTKSFLPKDAALGTMLVFTIPMSIIGGLIGLLYRNVDEYDLSKLNSFEKSKELNYIMKDHDAFR